MTGENPRTPKGFEEIARQALKDRVREEYESMVQESARELHSSLRTGEDAAENARRFMFKSTEYIECALFEFEKLGDLDSTEPTVRLVENGATVAADLAQVSGWVELPAEERKERGRTLFGGDSPAPGTPEHAARSLLRAWRELDDVAREAGEPLPEDLRPPENTEGE
jgi:hypothetical protein